MKLYLNKIMSLIDYLNELIDYSMGFPFYQVVEGFWRAGPAAPGQVPGPQRAKMLRPIDKGVSLLDFPFNNGFNP